MGFKISPKMLEKEASEEQMNEPNKELAQQVAILTAQVKKITDIVTGRDGALLFFLPEPSKLQLVVQAPCWAHSFVLH